MKTKIGTLIFVTLVLFGECVGQAKYVIPPAMNVVDAVKIGVKPGDTLAISSGTTPLRFIGILGSKEKPVVVTSYKTLSTITVPPTFSYGVKFEGCKYFRFTNAVVHGGNIGVTFDKLSTDFEVDHLEVHGQGFAGIMAKTDPTYPEAERGKFTMTNVSIHDNYIHNTTGEGIYVGNSFYSDTKAHEIWYVQIYNNRVSYSGWEGIQLGCATRGAVVYDNVVLNYGVANKVSQNNGIQIGEGTGGICFNNIVRDGPGNGIIVLGLGSLVKGNSISGAGESGIFCDDRPSTVAGFQLIGNTIINPKLDGIRLYADKPGTINVVTDNVISSPGSDQYVKVLGPSVKIAPGGLNYLIK